MVKDNKTLKDFNKEYIKNSNLTYEEKLRIYDGLWAEAVLRHVA